MQFCFISTYMLLSPSSTNGTLPIPFMHRIPSMINGKGSLRYVRDCFEIFLTLINEDCYIDIYIAHLLFVRLLIEF